MPTPGLDQNLKAAFARLDHEAIRALAAGLAPDDVLNDAARIAIAFGHLAAGEESQAAAQLAKVTGDGSAPLADFAYVRAFSRDRAGDHAAVVQIMGHLLDDPNATHGPRMRLRVADALLKLRQFGTIQKILKPLLDPPGCAQTLEAALILLETMIHGGAEKEHLIEQVTLIDFLLERGFRLPESGNVVYYGSMMHTNRIEASVGALLNAHELLLESHQAADAAEIVFLLIAGEKYKSPVAVRVAARAYIQKPFRLEELDPDKAAYLFTSHEEHEAGRQVLLASYTKAQINKEQSIWGPLVVLSYNSGHWKETLELLREHRNDLARLPIAGNARMMRAVSEYNLGRFAESLSTIASAGADFHAEARGFEAACEAFALIATGRVADVPAAARRAFAARNNETEFVNEYATAVLTELVAREHAPAFAMWIGLLGEAFRPEVRTTTLQRIGEMAAEWAWPWAVEQVAAAPALAAEPTRAALLNALAAAESGRVDQALACFSQALAHPEPLGTPTLLLHRARMYRRFGRYDDALTDCRAVLADEDFPRRHAALAIEAGCLKSLGRPQSEIDANQAQVKEFIQKAAKGRDEFTILNYETSQLFHGDAASTCLDAAKNVAAREPSSIEIIRLARRAARGHDAAPAIKDEAEALASRWMTENLLAWN